MTDIVPPEYYDTISYELRTELEMLSYNGEIYGIGPSTHSAKYSPSIVVSVYNKDMFEPKAWRIRTNSTSQASGPGTK